MQHSILDIEIQEFIDKNLEVPISKLALQKNPFPTIEWITILNQIEAKAKSKDKLPTWFNTKNIIYPSKISVEQTSSEKTATYKSTLVSGQNLIDLTGGFGVDDYYFAKKITAVTHCEINPVLSTLVKHNFEQLNTDNISCYAGDSLDTLTSLNTKWDWIYIDPSRRNDAKGKVFMLKDCLPNIPDNLDYYFKKSNAILIKTAPLLDLSAGLSELKHVKKIHVVAVENETVNILKDKTDFFEFVFNKQGVIPSYALPQKYLYEPNSAIMKSGGFDEIAVFFSLNKLHKHSHLYTSQEKIDFPGRIFEIQNCFSYSKSEMKDFLSNTKANITTRNFPDTVETIRKKWKIKEGGNSYCFFTTDENNNKIVLICNKI